MDSIDEADWVADRGIKPQIPNQGKALAAFTELDVESEKRTQQSLETFKSQMQKEMEEMKKVLLEEQVKFICKWTIRIIAFRSDGSLSV